MKRGGIFLIIVIFSSICPICWMRDSDYTVIDSDSSEMELTQITSEPGLPVKLKCHEDDRGSRVDDIAWEYKRCGSGLSLVTCEELPTKAPWQLALCRNYSKPCNGITLPILKPREADSGVYRCLYKNYMSREYRVHRVIKLDVRDPKMTSIEMLPEENIVDNQTVIESQKAVFRCRVRSVRKPYYIGWLRGEHNGDATELQKIFLNYQDLNFTTQQIGSYASTLYINDARLHDLNFSVPYIRPNKVFVSKLYINNAQLTDSGAYICFAIEDRGFVHKKVALVVLPIFPYSQELVMTNKILWIALALIALAICYTLVLFLLMRKISRRTILTPTQDKVDNASLLPVFGRRSSSH